MNYSTSVYSRARIVLLFATMAFASGISAEDFDAIKEITTCAEISDNSQRAACYDALGQQVLKANEDIAAGDLPDSIGGSDFAEKAGVEVATSRGLVTRCKKTLDKTQWFYFFEDGQVWKQVDRRKRRHKDCNFYVNISEDTFGYQMTIEGQDSKIRIKRIR